MWGALINQQKALKKDKKGEKQKGGFKAWGRVGAKRSAILSIPLTKAKIIQRVWRGHATRNQLWKSLPPTIVRKLYEGASGKLTALGGRIVYEVVGHEIAALEELDSDYAKELCRALTYRRVAKKHWLCSVKRHSDAFVMIASGHAVGYASDARGEVLVTYKKGDSFGSEQLLRRDKWAHSVEAISDVVELLELDRAYFFRYLEHVSGAGFTTKVAFLQRMGLPLFKTLAEQFAIMAVETNFRPGQVIHTRGSVATHVRVVYEGTIRVMRETSDVIEDAGIVANVDGVVDDYADTEGGQAVASSSSQRQGLGQGIPVPRPGTRVLIVPGKQMTSGGLSTMRMPRRIAQMELLPGQLLGDEEVVFETKFPDTIEAGPQGCQTLDITANDFMKVLNQTEELKTDFIRRTKAVTAHHKHQNEDTGAALQTVVNVAHALKPPAFQPPPLKSSGLGLDIDEKTCTSNRSHKRTAGGKSNEVKAENRPLRPTALTSTIGRKNMRQEFGAGGHGDGGGSLEDEQDIDADGFDPFASTAEPLAHIGRGAAVGRDVSPTKTIQGDAGQVATTATATGGVGVDQGPAHLQSLSGLTTATGAPNTIDPPPPPIPPKIGGKQPFGPGALPYSPAIRADFDIRVESSEESALRIAKRREYMQHKSQQRDESRRRMVEATTGRPHKPDYIALGRSDGVTHNANIASQTRKAVVMRNIVQGINDAYKPDKAAEVLECLALVASQSPPSVIEERNNRSGHLSHAHVVARDERPWNDNDTTNLMSRPDGTPLSLEARRSTYFEGSSLDQVDDGCLSAAAQRHRHTGSLTNTDDVSAGQRGDDMPQTTTTPQAPRSNRTGGLSVGESRGNGSPYTGQRGASSMSSRMGTSRGNEVQSADTTTKRDIPRIPLDTLLAPYRKGERAETERQRAEQRSKAKERWRKGSVSQSDVGGVDVHVVDGAWTDRPRSNVTQLSVSQSPSHAVAPSLQGAWVAATDGRKSPSSTQSHADVDGRALTLRDLASVASFDSSVDSSSSETMSKGSTGLEANSPTASPSAVWSARALVDDADAVDDSEEVAAANANPSIPSNPSDEDVAQTLAGAVAAQQEDGIQSDAHILHEVVSDSLMEGAPSKPQVDQPLAVDKKTNDGENGNGNGEDADNEPVEPTLASKRDVLPPMAVEVDGESESGMLSAAASAHGAGVDSTPERAKGDDAIQPDNAPLLPPIPGAIASPAAVVASPGMAPAENRKAPMIPLVRYGLHGASQASLRTSLEDIPTGIGQGAISKWSAMRVARMLVDSQVRAEHQAAQLAELVSSPTNAGDIIAALSPRGRLDLDAKTDPVVRTLATKVQGPMRPPPSPTTNSLADSKGGASAREASGGNIGTTPSVASIMSPSPPTHQRRAGNGAGGPASLRAQAAQRASGVAESTALPSSMLRSHESGNIVNVSPSSARRGSRPVHPSPETPMNQRYGSGHALSSPHSAPPTSLPVTGAVNVSDAFSHLKRGRQGEMYPGYDAEITEIRNRVPQTDIAHTMMARAHGRSQHLGDGKEGDVALDARQMEEIRRGSSLEETANAYLMDGDATRAAPSYMTPNAAMTTAELLVFTPRTIPEQQRMQSWVAKDKELSAWPVPIKQSAIRFGNKNGESGGAVGGRNNRRNAGAGNDGSSASSSSVFGHAHHDEDDDGDETALSGIRNPVPSRIMQVAMQLMPTSGPEKLDMDQSRLVSEVLCETKPVGSPIRKEVAASQLLAALADDAALQRGKEREQASGGDYKAPTVAKYARKSGVVRQLIALRGEVESSRDERSRNVQERHDATIKVLQRRTAPMSHKPLKFTPYCESVFKDLDPKPLECVVASDEDHFLLTREVDGWANNKYNKVLEYPHITKPDPSASRPEIDLALSDAERSNDDGRRLLKTRQGQRDTLGDMFQISASPHESKSPHGKSPPQPTSHLDAKRDGGGGNKRESEGTVMCRLVTKDLPPEMKGRSAMGISVWEDLKLENDDAYGVGHKQGHHGGGGHRHHGHTHHHAALGRNRKGSGK